jgi:hypothetical protein
MLLRKPDAASAVPVLAYESDLGVMDQDDISPQRWAGDT